MWLLQVLIVAFLLVLPGPAQARRVALVIGNASYKDTAQLTNTRNDATDIATALKRLQFEVLEGIDLDKRAMERLIRQFDQKLAGAEIALFFYAGHGMQVAGRNHLVPVDARLSAEGDIDFESLPLDLVLRRMEREAKTSLVLLDACRDNPLARNLARSMGTRSTSVGQGLAEVKTGVGTLISFSTQPGNVALDGEGRNSPYTSALLKQIETPGRDILTILASVRGDVVKSTGGKQVPWEHTSLLGPVVLSTLVGGEGARPAIPDQSASPQPQPGSSAAEAWPLVKDTTNVSALEAFVRRYGDTFHGDLAKARLAELSKPKPAAPAPIISSSRAPAPELSCNDALGFLKSTGAFGANPIQETAYAPKVTYYKRGQIGRAEVVSVARDYERKFPTRIYEIDDKTLAVRVLAEKPERLCQVRFEYSYNARNNIEERSGRGWSEFNVRTVGGRFEIISETGDIISRAVRSLR